MSDCIFHMTLRLLLSLIFDVKHYNFVITCYVCKVVMDVIKFPENL